MMSDHPLDIIRPTPDTPQRRPDSHAYPPETWELARELWLFVCSRSASRTQFELARRLGDATPSLQSIYWHAKHDNWAAWASQRLSELHPAIDRADIETLYLLRGAAIQRLDAIVRGHETATRPVVQAIEAALTATGVYSMAARLQPAQVAPAGDDERPIGERIRDIKAAIDERRDREREARRQRR